VKTAYVNVNVTLADDIGAADCAPIKTPLSFSIDNGVTITSKTLLPIGTPMVGDLDGDGYPEIVAPLNSAQGSWVNEAAGVLVYDTKTATEKTFSTARFIVRYQNDIGLAKARAGSEGLIVIESSDRYLYAYTKSGTQRWKSSVPIHTENTTVFAGTSFADFNGDGYAEIYANDKIFDLETGRLLLDLGIRAADIGTPGITGIAADFDGDGKPELAAFNKIYKINISSRAGTAGNSFSTWRTASVSMSDYTVYNVTAVADFDLDGNIDVLMHDAGKFYIWDANTGAV
jgi:hypothetical protein